MTDVTSTCLTHSTAVLGDGHEANKRRSWWVIGLCATMMVLEIGGGLAFGSIALVADGLHMSTHAGALLLAALAYTFASRHADDTRFTFGMGKLGDLAGFTSAIVLAMIALLIGYEAVGRFFAPVPIDFKEALPIAFLGLAVNIASVWLLGGHDHGHGDTHGHHHAHEDTARDFEAADAKLALSVFEDHHPPVFRLVTLTGAPPSAGSVGLATSRPDGRLQHFTFHDHGGYLQSVQEIPEPHAFAVEIRVVDQVHRFDFTEHDDHAEHGRAATHRDNNMRAAVVHVLADAAVSVLVIVGLGLAWAFAWSWMDPLAGIVGALVIATWSYSLVRDTGAILLDKVPDQQVATQVRAAVESEGDELRDFHLWRLGPGHLAAILSVATRSGRNADYYRTKLAHVRSLTHITVEVR